MTKSSKTRDALSDTNRPDVLIIGGGSAGLSAYLWSVDLGMRTLLVERQNEYGGQLLSIYNKIANYPGRRAANGRELCRHFLEGIADLDKFGRLNAAVESFDADAMTVRLEGGEVISARSIIVATGIRRRTLGVPGEAEFAGRGILESGAKEKERVSGEQVAIVGGGDAAMENALMLSERARKVYVVHRRDRLRARSDFVAAANKNKNIEFLRET